MRFPQVPTTKIDEAERKVNAILEDLEKTADADVKDIDLEDVVDTDPANGQPVVHRAVDITVQPRAGRSWLK